MSLAITGESVYKRKSPFTHVIRNKAGNFYVLYAFDVSVYVKHGAWKNYVDKGGLSVAKPNICLSCKTW